MLARATRRGHTIAVALALLSACTQTPELARAQRIEASYRLLYDGILVGHALFELAIDDDGGYQIEAFTTPAGEVGRAIDHEVLESSQGVIDIDGIRPSRYDHSVRQNGRLALVRLTFDWPQGALRLAGQDTSRLVGLLPDTHDRLSYLLVASTLAAAERGTAQIRVASSDATEVGLLELIGPADIEVPHGRYRAIGVRRATPDKDEWRELWFDTPTSPLPLLLLHHSGTNTVEMQLEALVNPDRSDPR